LSVPKSQKIITTDKSIFGQNIIKNVPYTKNRHKINIQKDTKFEAMHLITYEI